MYIWRYWRASGDTWHVKVKCPNCQREIPAEQINVGSDVAYCPRCENAFALSSLVAAGATDDVELGEPPPGCWMRVGFDDWEVGATTRSFAALFVIPFMCVWSGFSLGGIYGSQIAKGEFNLFQSLFGIPFLFGTVMLAAIAAMTVAGKVTLSVRDDRAESFIGVGSLGWRRRFDWSGIARVVEGPAANSLYGKDSGWIVLEGAGTAIRFGYGVKFERRAYLMRALRKMLVKTKRS